MALERRIPLERLTREQIQQYVEMLEESIGSLEEEVNDLRAFLAETENELQSALLQNNRQEEEEDQFGADDWPTDDEEEEEEEEQEIKSDSCSQPD